MEHDRESVKSNKDVSEHNSAMGKRPRRQPQPRKVNNHSKIAIMSQPNLMANGKGDSEPAGAAAAVFGSQPPIDLEHSSQKRTPVPSLALNKAGKDRSQAVLPGFTHTASQSGVGPNGLPSDRYVQAEAGGRTVRFFNTAQSPRGSRSMASVANLGGPAIPNTGIKALPSFDPKSLGASFSADQARGPSAIPASAVVGQSVGGGGATVIGSVGSIGRSIVGSVGNQIPLETTEDMPFPFLPQEPTAMFSSLGEPLEKYCRTGINKRRDRKSRINRASRKSKANLVGTGESGEAPPSRPATKATGRGTGATGIDPQAMMKKARSVPTSVSTARDEGDDEAVAAQETDRKKGLRLLPHHFPTFTSRGKHKEDQSLDVLDLGDETEKPAKAKSKEALKAAAPRKGTSVGKVNPTDDVQVKKEPSAVSFGGVDDEVIIIEDGGGDDVGFEDPDDVGVGADSGAEVYPDLDRTDEEYDDDDDDDESFDEYDDDDDEAHTPVPKRRVHILDEDEIPEEFEKDESFRPDHFCVRLQALEIWFENEMAVQLSMSSAAMLVLFIRMVTKFGGF